MVKCTTSGYGANKLPSGLPAISCIALKAERRWLYRILPQDCSINSYLASRLRMRPSNCMLVSFHDYTNQFFEMGLYVNICNCFCFSGERCLFRCA